MGTHIIKPSIEALCRCSAVVLQPLRSPNVAAVLCCTHSNGDSQANSDPHPFHANALFLAGTPDLPNTTTSVTAWSSLKQKRENALHV
jgi:hypothetical protein